MNKTDTLGAVALAMLLAAAAPQTQARQAQAQAQTQGPLQTPQQAREAQRAVEARQAAQAYLNREEAAATRSQTEQTDKANRDAAVADETGGGVDGAQAARKGADPSAAAKPRAGTATPPPTYGPVLNPRQPQALDPNRKDPAEVHDETDTRARPAQPASQGRQKQASARRHPAWQNVEPMAPRPLNAGAAPAIGTGMVPVPPPARPPQPVVPSSAPLSGCVGGTCLDAAGNSYNLGPNGTGISSTGRACTRTGTTVQCF